MLDNSIFCKKKYVKNLTRIPCVVRKTMVKFLQNTSIDNMTTTDRIKDFIDSKEPGWVFTAKDLLDLGTEEAVHVTLHRLNEKGDIKRVSHGIYYKPVVNEMFGPLPPDAKSVAQALADKYRIRIQPSGAYAANLLGLSEQVPAKVVFLTDGDNKKVKVGKLEIVFKKTTPKNMAMAGRISGLVVQAIKFMGKDHIDQKKISKIRKKLTIEDKKILKEDADLAPVWIRKIIRQNILEESNG